MFIIVVCWCITATNKQPTNLKHEKTNRHQKKTSTVFCLKEPMELIKIININNFKA